MLSKYLDCMEPQVVSFIGGGGKTSTIRRLAQELNEIGKQVIITTTTRFAAAEGLSFEHRLLTADFSNRRGLLENGLPDQELLLIGSVLETDKFIGVSPEVVDQIHALAPQRHLLVEADGAAKKPFKAPAVHEPVIPASSGLVVAMVGAWAIGLPLLPEYLHRPELISHLTGLAVGEHLTVEALACGILHPQGYRKGVPAGARFAVLINGVQPQDEENARQLGWYLRKAGVAKVLLTNVREEPPVKEVLI